MPSHATTTVAGYLVRGLASSPSSSASSSPAAAVRNAAISKKERTLMSHAARIESRPVRHAIIDTGRPHEAFRAEYEQAVPHFDRLEAIGVVLSGAGCEGIKSLSAATAIHGFVNFFVFDPSPVMALNGNTGRVVTYLTGNSVLAERGFRLDPACFLYVPLRVGIAEGADGNARLSIDLPGDLFAAFGTAGLDEMGGLSVTSSPHCSVTSDFPSPRASPAETASEQAE
jgi:hypothetical protein